MQHVNRKHRVDLDSTLERINKNESVAIKSINTKDLIADMLTRGQFKLQQYTTVMHVFAMHAPSRGDVVNSSFPRSMASHTAAASLSVGTSGFRDFPSAARATACRTAKQKSA